MEEALDLSFDRLLMMIRVVHLVTSSHTLATQPTVPNDCVRVNNKLERKQKNAGKETAWETQA